MAKQGSVTSGKKRRAQVKTAPVIEEIKIPWSAKVAIVGFAPTRNMAPFDDKSWEIWGVNELYTVKDVERVDVLFELHDYKWIKEGKRSKEHLPSLQKMTIPIWMQQHYQDIPKSLPFPRQQLHDKYGHYFTNTISWEIALAMHIGVKEIGLWGVNMATDIEYASQRPSVEYFVGLARGAGIKVYIPPESDLLKTAYQYGFEDGELSIFSTKIKAYMGEQDQKIAALNPAIQNNIAQVNQAVGAKAAMQYIERAFVYPSGNFPCENPGMVKIKE